MNTIKDDAYQIIHQQDDHVVSLSGEICLGSREYQPIEKLLYQAASQQPETLVLDLRNLRILNSAGINTLIRFLVQVKDQELCSILVMGNQAVDWQRKVMRNLQRLMAGSEFSLDWN